MIQSIFGERKYSNGRCDICGHKTNEKVIEIIDLAGHEECIYMCIEDAWKSIVCKCPIDFK